MFPLTDLHYRVSHIQIYTTDFPFALQNICVPSEWSLKICLNVVILPAFKHIALSSSWAMFLTRCAVHVGVTVLAEVDYFLRLYVPGHGQMKHTIELYFHVKKFSFMSLEWLEFWRMRCWVSRWYCEGSANLWVHVLLCTFLVGIPVRMMDSLQKMLGRDPLFPRLGELTQDIEFSKLYWFFYARIWDASSTPGQLIWIGYSWFILMVSLRHSTVFIVMYKHSLHQSWLMQIHIGC